MSERGAECSICSQLFYDDEGGCQGSLGIIQFAFCATCRVGIWDWAQQSFDLVSRPDCEVVNCPCGFGVDNNE